MIMETLLCLVQKLLVWTSLMSAGRNGGHLLGLEGVTHEEMKSIQPLENFYKELGRNELVRSPSLDRKLKFAFL